jgi:hypothetical protein
MAALAAKIRDRAVIIAMSNILDHFSPIFKANRRRLE